MRDTYCLLFVMKELEQTIAPFLGTGHKCKNLNESRKINLLNELNFAIPSIYVITTEYKLDRKKTLRMLCA